MRLLRIWDAIVRHGAALFVEAHEPQDFRHHVILRDADPRLFEALHRDLGLRLFDGRCVTRGGVRMTSLRQGLSPVVGACLFGLGCLGLISSLLAGSELGLSSRLQAWDGGAAQAAVPSLDWSSGPLRSAVLPVALGLIGASLALGCLARKQFWLVAQPSRAEGRIDLWIAATSRTRPAEFAAEFADFLQRAAQLDSEFGNPRQRSDAAPAHEPGEAGAATTHVGNAAAAPPRTSA